MSETGQTSRIPAGTRRAGPLAESASMLQLVPGLTPLAAALLVSVPVLAFAAAKSAMVLSAMVSGMAAGAIVAVAAYANADMWSDPRSRRAGSALLQALARNAGISALAYAWGSAAMFAIYVLAGLKWQHGWQYGLAMALFSGLHIWFLARLADPASWFGTQFGQDVARGLSALHGLAAFGALVFLLQSGKLARLRPDWAANQIFVAGLVSIVAICALAAYTNGRLAKGS